MGQIFKKLLLSSSLLALSLSASAGIIIGTDNDSFIDDATSLEWMKFGVNSADTYDFVASQLGTGQAYDGWRLATKDEVYNMYSNTFLSLSAEFINPLDSVGRSTVIDGQNKPVSVFDSIFDLMGYNTLRRLGTPFEIRWASGLFEGDDGLSLFKTYDLVGSFEKKFSGDQVSFYDHANFDYLSNSTSAEYSTMLIKTTSSGSITSVPEPSTVFILSLGIVGLLTRKYIK